VQPGQTSICPGSKLAAAPSLTALQPQTSVTAKADFTYSVSAVNVAAAAADSDKICQSAAAAESLHMSAQYRALWQIATCKHERESFRS
jgi:hypothetical protein